MIQKYAGKKYLPTHVGVSEMSGPVVPVAVLRTHGFELIGLQSFVKETSEKTRGHNPLIVECLASAREEVGRGNPVLLVCALLRDKNLPGDMDRKRNFRVYSQNGRIRYLSAIEISATHRGPVERRKNFSSPDAFHMEHFAGMIPEGCTVHYHPEQFSNWVCILCVPRNAN